MKLAGLLLLVAGWGIVLSAIALLRSLTLAGAFVAAGAGVELLGLALAVKSHIPVRGRKR